MQPHQERVLLEKVELDQKLTKLTTFIQGGTYQLLPAEEQVRLNKQARIMKDYSTVLAERIAAFPA